MDEIEVYRIKSVNTESYDPVDDRDNYYLGYVQRQVGNYYWSLSGTKSAFGHAKKTLRGDKTGVTAEYERGVVTGWAKIV